MKAQMVITHVASGKRWCNDPQEVDEATFEEMRATLKANISDLNWMESAQGDILPGDFIRQHCVITLCKIVED
jgi:hypothetical protein